MRIDVLTLFPEMFSAILDSSILKRAIDKTIIDINVINFRDYATGKHKVVDDTPYGGGGGMLLKPEPIFNAVSNLPINSNSKIILMCPQGEKFSQHKAVDFSKLEHLVLICGHYEGFDERIREYLATDELSIGDYVLTGGEIPAMVVIDAVARLLPGVLGNSSSASNDSFSDGYLEFPQYTRPADFQGMTVPEVLLSGHHDNIAKWRQEQSIKKTQIRRPDLLENK